MKLALSAAAVAGYVVGLGRGQSCCSQDSHCTDQMSTADIEYQSQFGKTLECDQGCPGKINCNMFGICEQCRGCFETCEGAIMFMEATSSPAEFINFCTGIGIADISECNDEMSGSGFGSGSTSSGSHGSGSGSGVGVGSGSRSSGSASGAGSASGGVSGSGIGSGSAGVSSDGYASGAGSGSGAISAGGSGSSSSGSGEGSGTGSMATASGSGDGSRVADIPGCDCGTAELDPSFAAYFCENNKSMYCDLECVDDPDPADVLFPDMGGLWCQPGGWEGCRTCKFDCENYDGDGCVPCPADVQNWC